MSEPSIILKVCDKRGKKVRKVMTRNTRRIYRILEAGKFPDCLYFLKVKYNNGNTNEGDYRMKKELVQALKAFTEPD